MNGRPSPIRQSDEGFVLSLDSDASAWRLRPRECGLHNRTSATDCCREAFLEVKTAEKSPTDVGSGLPRVYEIRLRFFPSSETKPGHFEIQVPETARTTVRVEKSGPGQMVTLETTTGKPRRLESGESSVEVGQTGRMVVQSGPLTDETTNPAIAAQAVQILRVSPALVEMECRVTYDRKSGAPEKFTWLVPASAAVRATSDTYRASLRVRSPDKNGDPSAGRQGGKPALARDEMTVPEAEQLVPLDFDCSAVPSGPLTLTATLLLPIDSKQNAPGAPSLSVRLPHFDGAGADQAGIRLTSNQVGVSAAAGYRVVAMMTGPNLSHTTKADQTFRQESFGTRKEPDLIFDGQGISVLPLQLSAIVPTDRVRLMTHEARISADQIQWKTMAEIRTENAPAFVHVLRVDPRLKIDSASVREDGVERLVRFSQTGDEVTLFLRDRAAATQDLVMTGRLPLEPGHATRVPSVSLVHAVVSDVRLAVSRDPDVDVTVSDSPGVVRVTGGGPSIQRSSNAGTTQDVREYSVAAGATMPEIRVTRRSETAQAAKPAGSAAKNTKLSAAQMSQSPKRPATALERPEQKPRVSSHRVAEPVGQLHVGADSAEELPLALQQPVRVRENSGLGVIGNQGRTASGQSRRELALCCRQHCRQRR